MQQEDEGIKYVGKRMIKMMVVDSIGNKVPGLLPINFSYSLSYLPRAKSIFFGLSFKFT